MPQSWVVGKEMESVGIEGLGSDGGIYVMTKTFY